ncbi:hypothetical protein [Micromonospora globispora]|uniref:hypothetical protein n=1 Tax=Micromonospora globispora TaxID=1450148 RepID=UPI000F50139E|nr:hypothetical protein [Micromonospora globispora]
MALSTSEPETVLDLFSRPAALYRLCNSDTAPVNGQPIRETGLHSVDWGTVATSVVAAACTAVFVTLAVGYLAKPSLEARKERILQQHKARRNGRTQLLRIRELGIRLSAHRRIPKASTSNRALHREIYAEFNKELPDAVKKFDEAFQEIAPSLPRLIYSAVTGYLGVVKAIAMSEGSWSHKGSNISLATLPMIDVWDTPRWRCIRLRRRVRQLELVLDTAVDLFRQGKGVEALDEKEPAGGTAELTS